MRDLTVTLIQAPLDWEDKTANLQRFDRHIAALGGKTDLIVLPEMFSTGFSMQPAPLAEGPDGPTFSWMAQKVKETGAVITGSLIASENGAFYNRLVWMQPDGEFHYYNKRHLFTHSREDHNYQPGHKRLIAEINGWKVCPLICYDLRFPVWSRNTEQYDVLLYVANWPEPRRNAWKSLLIARAIENQAYTLGLNRIGTDGNGLSYTGDSLVADYAGEPILHVAQQEGAFTVQLNHEAQQTFRKKLAFLPDQDRFQILD